MTTAEEIFSIMLANEIKVDFESLDHSESLAEQGLDSLDITTILFAMEERFEIRFAEEDLEQGNLASINDIVAYINKAQ